MARMRGFVGPLTLWLVAVIAAGWVVWGGQTSEREALVDRTQNRAETGADFVSAYVDDVFDAEERLAARVTAAGWNPDTFVEDAELLGFPAAVLLDRNGRVAATAPASADLQGTDLAPEYAHLRAALAGERAVSDVVPSAVEQRPVVAFALPLSDPALGVLSGAFDLSDSPLATFVARQPIAGMHGMLLDSSGSVVVAAGDTELVRQRLTALREPGGTPMVTADRVLAAAPVEGTGWTYVLDAPRQTLLSPATSNDPSVWLLLGAVAAVGLVGLGFLQHARRRSAASEARFRTSFANAPIGQLIISLREPDSGRLVAANPAAERMLGYSEAELASTSLRDITHPDDLAQDEDVLPRLLGGELETAVYEKRFVRPDGSVVWTALSASVIREADGTPLHSITQLLDITERRAQAEQLAELHRELEQRALYDPLTGVANRGLLMDRLTKALATRGAAAVAVGFCDLDHFKRINDTHGHQVGDAVLEEVAVRLEACVRGGDTVARLGGDEFVLLLTSLATAAEARAVLDRASQAVKEPIVVGDLTIRTSLSGGLAIAADGATDADALLRDADFALYAAKDKGRGRIEDAPAAPSMEG